MRFMAMNERFWNYVEKGPSVDDCWLWRGCLDSQGYGKVTLANLSGKRRVGQAHRVAWNLVHGFDPGQQIICHTCDNPVCVNPRHMMLGDHRVNALHREQRGRSNHSNRRPGKLASDVSNIKRLHSEGMNTYKIAKIYGANQRSIADIVMGRSYGSTSRKYNYQNQKAEGR